ncbi:MAG TPA: flagellar export protein FliJ [Paenalcaligenes sp.]|nr:flagellar export protein FliJ [Paenalcaligenes sp.]
MSKPNTFDLLIELANHQTNEVAQRLSALITERNAATEQLDALHVYRLDYAQRLLEAGKSGVAMSNYLNFRRFINTLDEAIQQQNSRLDVLNQRVQYEQSQWLEEKQRLNAYETLQKRRHNEWLNASRRHEQRVNDEMSAALVRRAQYSY